MNIKKLSRLEIRKLVEVFIRDKSGKLVKIQQNGISPEEKTRPSKKLKGTHMKLTYRALKKIIKESMFENQFLSIEKLDTLRAEWKRRSSDDLSKVFLVNWRYPNINELNNIEQILYTFDKTQEIVANGFGAFPLTSFWAAENPGESVGLLLQGDIKCAFKRDVESFSQGKKLYPRFESEEEFWEETVLSLSDLPSLSGPLHNEFFVSNWRVVAIIIPQALQDVIIEYSEEFLGFNDSLNLIAQNAGLPILNEFAKKIN